MSEIEKMYENAGIDYEERYNNCTLNKEGQCELKCSCDICKYSEEKYIYPTFTAKKQIEITKFLLKKAVYYDVKDDKYWFYLEECESAGYKPFDEAIAHCINKLWKDLTEEEQQQVKGILK